MGFKYLIPVLISIAVIFYSSGCDIDDPVAADLVIEGRIVKGNIPHTYTQLMLNHKPPIVQTSSQGFFRFKLLELTTPYNLFLNQEGITFLNINSNKIRANLDFISHGVRHSINKHFRLNFPRLKSPERYYFFVQSDDIDYFDLQPESDTTNLITCLTGKEVSSIKVLMIKYIQYESKHVFLSYSAKTFTDLSQALNFKEEEFLPVTSTKTINVFNKNNGKIYATANIYSGGKLFHGELILSVSHEDNFTIEVPELTNSGGNEFNYKLRFSNTGFNYGEPPVPNSYLLSYDPDNLIIIEPHNFFISSPGNSLNLSNNPKITVNYQNNFIYVYRIYSRSIFSNSASSYSIVTDKNDLTVREIVEANKDIALPLISRVNVTAIEGFNSIDSFLSEKNQSQYNKIISTDTKVFTLYP